MNASISEPTLVALDSLIPVGHGLHRPESVLVTAGGDIYCADWRGGVTRLHADGRQSLITARSTPPLKPNGIALLGDGSLLLAQLGDADGGVYQLGQDGQARPWLLEVDGRPLPPTNFVCPSADGACWVTVSTQHQPRASAYRADVADGFIVRHDHRGARIVADGLGYTNEVAEHEGWLYVNETFARRLSRFAIRPDGSLGSKEVVTRFGHGCFPDGLAFDEQGNAWVVSIVSNRLIRVARDGAQQLWLEDADADHVEAVERAFSAGTMGRPHLDRAAGRRLKNISSIAFCGPGRREALLGNLLGDCLHRLAMPAAGAPLPHWTLA